MHTLLPNEIKYWTLNLPLIKTTLKSAQYNKSYNLLTSWLADLTEKDVKILFNLLTATLLNNEQRWLSESPKTWRNLAVRIVSSRCTDRKLKLRWHSAITADELVRNIFINTLVVVNSRELWSHASRGYASVAYMSIGKHLEQSKVITVSSDAVHLTLL